MRSNARQCCAPSTSYQNCILLRHTSRSCSKGLQRWCKSLELVTKPSSSGLPRLSLATSPNYSFSDITNLPHQLRVPIAEIALRRGFPQPKKPPGEPFARLFAGEDPPGSQMSQTEPVSVCPWLEGRRCIGCVSHKRVTSRQHIFCDYHHLVIVILFFFTPKS